MNPILTFALRLILILLSYAFVGWVGYAIYADLRGGFRKRAEKGVPPITLETQLDQQPLVWRFKKPEIILGRDPACDFPLDDERISLRHCKLSFHHNQWWTEDLASTNGTYLNNVLIESAVILTDRDELRLGQINLSIKINQLSEME